MSSNNKIRVKDLTMKSLVDEYKCEYPFVEGYDNDILAIYINAYFWICGVGLCIIAGFGILGNIVNIALFTSKDLRSTFHMYLVVLAIFDLGFLFLESMTSILQIYDVKCQGTISPDPNWTPNEFWIMFYPYLIRPFKYTFLTASEIFTVVISVDRYIAIKYPFRYQLSWNTNKFQTGLIDIRQLKAGGGDRKITASLIDWKRVSIYSVSAFLFSFFYCIPLFFEYTSVEKNGTVSYEFTGMNGTVYGFIYYIILESVILVFIPVGILLYTNIGIYRIAKKQRRSLTENIRYRSKSQNVMLFGVVALLMVENSYRFGCRMYVTSCYDFYGEDYIEYCGVNLNDAISFAVLRILWTIICSASCFIYLFTSEKFRELMMKYLHF